MESSKIKRGVKEAPQKTAQQIANSKPVISTGVAKPVRTITADELSKEFNEFLKLKGLSSEYKVEIVETE